MATEESNPERSLPAAQFEELQLKIEKLKLDLAELKKGKPWYQSLVQFVPVATALIAIAGFSIGLFRYQADQKVQSDRDQVSREREFMKPWVENQREIYRKALSAVGTVANTENDETRRKAAEQFWSLYHGEMILVETRPVSQAMIAFGLCLEGSNITCPKTTVDRLAHNLGTAMHDSMAETAAMTFQEYSSSQDKYGKPESQ